MSTLIKPKRQARKAMVKSSPYDIKTRPPPPAKNTSADLLKLQGFGKGLDGDLVMAIVADRHL